MQAIVQVADMMETIRISFDKKNDTFMPSENLNKTEAGPIPSSESSTVSDISDEKTSTSKARSTTIIEKILDSFSSHPSESFGIDTIEKLTIIVY